MTKKEQDLLMNQLSIIIGGLVGLQMSINNPAIKIITDNANELALMIQKLNND